MLYRIAAALLGLLAPVLILIAHKIITNKLSLLRFKKLTKGMPIWKDYKLLGNHILTLSFGENCLAYERAHALNGPYVAGLMGDKYCVSTIDLDLIKRIVLDEVHLDRTSLDLPIAELEQSIMLVPASKWRHQRRVFAPALKSNKFKTPNVMMEIELSIGKLISHIELQLGAHSNESTLEADDIIHKYSLNLVLNCFYKQVNLINFDDPNDEWTGMVDAMLIESSHSWPLRLSMVFPWFRAPLDWFVWHFHKVGVARRKIIDFVRMQTKLGMEARLHLEESRNSNQEPINKNNFLLKDGTRFRRNIVDGIIDGFLDGKLTKSEYFNSSCFLLEAADKTAADCIVFTLYLLSINQDVQERLRKSVRANGADSEYLGWVLNESLRLMPPAPTGCSRTISRPIELKQGWLIPTGTVVITNAYVIHRLKQYWGEDADEFKPDRWADTSRHHPMQYIPFGAGPRGCPGREFALFHMKSLFAALLTRYEFEGQVRADALKFSSPALIFLIPNSPTFVKIKRLS